jgi:hypothetical protein
MKLLDSQLLTNKFHAEYLYDWKSEPKRIQALVGQFTANIRDAEMEQDRKISIK